MADPKLLLTAVSEAIDAERATSTGRIAELAAEVFDLQQQVATLDARIAEIDPWHAIDKTGATEVTLAVQRILAAGPAKIPPGTYLVNPANPLFVTYDLEMAYDTAFVAMPSPSPRDCIIRVVGDGLKVRGGHAIGDRLSGAYTAGSTNEWGYGMVVAGNDCTIEDFTVEQCTGDGIGVVGRNCTLNRVIATKNRRQGVSVFATGFRANECQFTFTGALGTDPAAPNGPCAGIDFEPDANGVIDAVLTDCRLDHNRTGLLAWLRQNVGGSMSIVASGCSMEGNANGAWVKALAGQISLAVNGCSIIKNTGSGVKADMGSIVGVNGCTFTGIAMRTPFDLQGTDVRTRYDIPTGFGGKLSVGINHYK